MENTSTPTREYTDSVALQLTGGYSIDDLEEAFESIANPDDWKSPIDARIPMEKRAVTEAAIKFFTATVPTFRFVGETEEYIVTSIGYRNGPAGDY